MSRIEFDIPLTLDKYLTYLQQSSGPSGGQQVKPKEIQYTPSSSVIPQPLPPTYQTLLTNGLSLEKVTAKYLNPSQILNTVPFSTDPRWGALNLFLPTFTNKVTLPELELPNKGFNNGSPKSRAALRKRFRSIPGYFEPLQLLYSADRPVTRNVYTHKVKAHEALLFDRWYNNGDENTQTQTLFYCSEHREGVLPPSVK